MTNKGFFKSYRCKPVLYKKKDIGTHVAVYIEDKYMVLGFNDYKGGGILEFTRNGQKVLCEVYKSYRFAKLKYLKVVKH